MLPALVALSLGLAACGATVSQSDAGVDRTQPPADTTPAVDAPTPTDVMVRVDVPTPGSPCPATQPVQGSACSRLDLECEYGTDPRRECRPYAVCARGSWMVFTPRTTGPDGRPWCATDPPPAACPASRAAAEGQPCDAQGAVCAFGGAQCLCTSCVSFPVGTCTRPRVWVCDATPTGCPAASPRFGEVCAQDSLQCNYGCNSPNGSVVCRNGVWQRGDFRDCPISTVRAKRDIAYLTPAEVDALAEQLRTTRLATYEYTIPSMAGRRRLGFILEDQPHSFAVDPEHSQVDLYGFASLLAATVQSQDRELRAMRLRVEALERRLSAREARRAPVRGVSP